MNDIMDDNGKG